MSTEKQIGPISHRIMIYAFAAILTLLLIWAIGYILSDIGNIKGPDWQVIQTEAIGSSLQDQQQKLNEEKTAIVAQIENQQENQKILKTSMGSSKETMEQLLSLHRLALEKSVKPTADQQNALAESQTLYLASQQQFQQANNEIVTLTEQQRQFQQKIDTVTEKIDTRRELGREKFDTLMRTYRWKTAGLKLLLIIPLLLGVTWLLVFKRKSDFAPLVFAAFVATFVQTGMIMQQYFPAEFFHYILIGVAILVVVIILRHLIRLASSPQKDWLLKQYKEAYRKWLCPVCNFPIRRGLRKEVDWSSRKLRGAVPVLQKEEEKSEEPYTCPSCGQLLYEKCEDCQYIRHSLLPFCEACSGHKEMV